MNGNIKVGNLFGIPFYVNPSWFLVLGLITFSYGQELARLPQLNSFTSLALGFVTAILLFASVLAHELGHSFVAQAQGIEVKSITLFLFGGLASLDKESKTPWQAFLVAIAGPFVSLILFGLLTLTRLNLELPLPGIQILYLLASINLILAVFNLIPGLPLDGGNILKALVWQVTGNPNKGTIFASRVGQAFGWLAVSIGVGGILNIIPFGSFWTLLMGGFLLQNAGFSAQSATIQETLDRYCVEEAIIPNSPLVPAELSLREFANDYIIGKEQWQKFLVVDGEGKLLGEITTEAIKTIATSQWNSVLVAELMQPAKVDRIKVGTSLLDVAKSIEAGSRQAIIVINEEERVLGAIDRQSIINLLQQKQLATK
jgi:Zn-dependent protease/CBS domain-containing protein